MKRRNQNAECIPLDIRRREARLAGYLRKDRKMKKKTSEIVDRVERMWEDAPGCWTAPVTDDDGAAAGNIVQREHRVVRMLSGGYCQQTRLVAINQSHIAYGAWREEELTWGATR